MTRVLMAGFLHETNTFAATPARWENFVNGEGFPAMHRGPEVLELANVNIPLGGFVTAAAADWELLPVIWCAASPSGPVEAATFERVTEIITEACTRERPDAVYLDLHGAMVSDEHHDADGEVIRRVREAIGPETPLVVSLDLHANISDRMLETADAMAAYRTYPHVDMAETGRTCAGLLGRILAGERLVPHVERVDFLIPTIAGSTMEGPAQELYALLQDPEPGRATLSIAMAFPASDVPECRPCVFGYGSDLQALREEVAEVAREIAQREHQFVLDALPAEEAVRQAAQSVAEGIRPVIIADTQDNPGAGGDATTTGLLRHLLHWNAPGSALAAIHDPDIVRKAIESGESTEVTVTFPGSSTQGDAALTATFLVERITDGRVRFDGPMMHGNELSVGPSVLLRSDHVRVVVNSHKAQIMDRNQFRAAGVVPEDQDILAVKSSVHFRGDYTAIAGRIIVALAPGPFPADPAQLPWRHLAPGVRLGPLGPEFQHRDPQAART